MQSFFQSVIHRHTEFQPNYSVSYQTSNFHAVVFPINYSQKESATTYRSSAVCCADHKKTGERKQKKKKNKRKKTEKKTKNTGVNNPFITTPSLPIYTHVFVGIFVGVDGVGELDDAVSGSLTFSVRPALAAFHFGGYAALQQVFCKHSQTGRAWVTAEQKLASSLLHNDLSGFLSLTFPPTHHQ